METIALVGLGYVGLPLAYHFDKEGFKVIGYDIYQKRIDDLKNGIDVTREIGPKIKDSTIDFTTDIEKLKQADIIIITVPTPIDKTKNPDFIPLQKSSEAVGKILQKGQIVVYESTVYPGCTQEICQPILEKFSGLKCPQDFKIGYSPERINPGDKEHTVEKIVKVVAGIDAETTEKLAEVYGKVIKAGIHKAANIMVAEAAKVIENTQRDINIALMNELSQIFNKIGINTYDVLAASGTKWNFLKFSPGLVGGHCIGVDPYWLAYKSAEIGHHPQLILAGRRINDDTPTFVVNEFIKQLIKGGINIKGSKILILGLTFKENVPDFRNSKIGDVIGQLKELGVKISIYDPYYKDLNHHEMEELNVTNENIIPEASGKFDGIIYALNHNEYEGIDLKSLLNQGGAIFDIKGKFKDRGYDNYMSL